MDFDPKLNFGKHVRITKEKADNANKIVKALSGTSWGKQKRNIDRNIQSHSPTHIRIWQHSLVTNHKRHQQKQTPNHPEHSSQNCNRMHTRHQHPTLTCRNQSSPSFTSSESSRIQLLSKNPTNKPSTSSSKLQQNRS